VRLADEFPGVGGPADGGVLAESEDGGQVQRVCAGGDGFFELAVDAQAFEGSGQATQIEDPRVADRAVSQCAFLADEQVRVGGVLTSRCGLAVFGQRSRR
jgi:hypothetical protein